MPEDPSLTLPLKLPELGDALAAPLELLTFKLPELKAPGGSSCLLPKSLKLGRPWDLSLTLKLKFLN